MDVRDLVTIGKVMEEQRLGPNGALLYCMDMLDQNFSWLQERLDRHPDAYFVFDCPGQVELFICDNSFQRILQKLAKLHFRVEPVSMFYSNMYSYVRFIWLILSTAWIL